MQFKPVPEPPTEADPIETVAAVRAALPAEADPELDCCARVIEGTAVDGRDDASDWITFLRALELAVAEENGYRRVSVPNALDRRVLAGAFCDRVVGVADVLETLPDGPESGIDAAAVFDRLEATDRIPTAARRRHGDSLERVWTDRIDRVLRWAAALDLAEPVDGGYRTRVT